MFSLFAAKMKHLLLFLIVVAVGALACMLFRKLILPGLSLHLSLPIIFVAENIHVHICRFLEIFGSWDRDTRYTQLYI